MVEKLPLDFVRSIYKLLTTGNENVNFYCSCIQNQNREAATNQPVKFAFNLLKVNLICRLPLLKNRTFAEPLGQKYLSELFVRPAVCELASEMLDNTQLITNIFGSAVFTIKSNDEIYELIEEETSVKGFAKLRKKYDSKKLTIQSIYKNISSELNTMIDYKIELAVMEKYYIANKYVIRLLDIAKYNDLKITAIIPTSYPANFIQSILEKFKIEVDELIVTPDCDLNIKSYVDPTNTIGIMSSDYNGYIKKFMKLGCKPIYYRSPKMLMEHTVHPALDKNFQDIYDGICGSRLFSGIKRMSPEYELAYLCIAPAVFGFAQHIIKRVAYADKMICLCDENSIFGTVLKKLANTFQPEFFPWSALATSKYKSIDDWQKIIDEYPVFNDAEYGVFDDKLRYPISKAKGNYTSLELARIMATAWIDKSSDGAENAVKQKLNGCELAVIADPVAGRLASSKFCSIMQKVSPKTIYKCFTINEFLKCDTEKLKALAVIMQGNKPMLCQINDDNKQWIYPKKLNVNKLSEIYRAIVDFADDFIDYFTQSGNIIDISGENCTELYLKGHAKISKIF